MATVGDVIQKAAAALEDAEGRDLLERNLQMSAVYEYVDRAATDLRMFRPERVAEIKELSDYAAAVASKAGLSRALGQAQAGVKKSAADVAKSFAASPAMATLLASAPVTIFLKWVGVLEAVGESIGELAGYLLVAVGLVSVGVLVTGARGLSNAWSSISSSLAQRSGRASVMSLPGRVRANLRQLDQTVESFLTSVGRRHAQPPIFERAQAFMWGIVATGVASVCIAVPAAYVGFSNGYDKACGTRPDSRTCAPQDPFSPGG